MTYTNEKCPVCGKAFTDDDDVVVCPICGTPHHRQCYIDNKVCANDGLHSGGYEWKPSATVQASAQPSAESEPEGQKKPDDGHKIVFCPNCGKENPAEEPVCLNCGTRLYNNGQNGMLSQPITLPDMSNQQFGTPVVQISPDDTIGGEKVSDVAEFIQFNSNRYIPKFYKMEKTGKKASFNWGALLFSPYWFFFRKMHVVGFAIMVILLLTTGLCTTDRMVSAVENYGTVMTEYYQGNASYEEMSQASQQIAALPEAVIMTAVELAVRVFSGVFGNALYKKKVLKDMSEIKQRAASPEEYRILLFKKGGISGGMCALAILGYYCAEQLLYTLISKT